MPSYPSTDSSSYGSGTTSSAGATGYGGTASRYNSPASSSYDRDSASRARRRPSLRRQLDGQFQSVRILFRAGRQRPFRAIWRQLRAVEGQLLHPANATSSAAGSGTYSPPISGYTPPSSGYTPSSSGTSGSGYSPTGASVPASGTGRYPPSTGVINTDPPAYRPGSATEYRPETPRPERYPLRLRPPPASRRPATRRRLAAAHRRRAATFRRRATATRRRQTITRLRPEAAAIRRPLAAIHHRPAIAMLAGRQQFCTCHRQQLHAAKRRLHTRGGQLGNVGCHRDDHLPGMRT